MLFDFLRFSQNFSKKNNKQFRIKLESSVVYIDHLIIGKTTGILWGWKRSLVKFVRFNEDCDQHGDRMSKNDESCHIWIRWLKVNLVYYEKYGTQSI